jgi:hypothetical protein
MLRVKRGGALRVTITLSADEKANLYEIAQKREISVSDLMREKIKDEIRLLRHRSENR